MHHKQPIVPFHISIFTPHQVAEIKERAMYILINKEPMIQHNIDMLFHVHGPKHPVARTRGTLTDGKGKAIKFMKHFQIDQTLKITTSLCQNAKVQISGRNHIEPDWGLCKV